MSRSPRQVLFNAFRGDAEIERFVLHIAFAEIEGEFGFHQFATEIEGMCVVAFDGKMRKQRHRIARDVMVVTVIKMDAVVSDLDAIIRVAYIRRAFGDLSR